MPHQQLSHLCRFNKMHSRPRRLVNHIKQGCEQAFQHEPMQAGQTPPRVMFASFCSPPSPPASVCLPPPVQKPLILRQFPQNLPYSCVFPRADTTKTCQTDGKLAKGNSSFRSTGARSFCSRTLRPTMELARRRPPRLVPSSTGPLTCERTIAIVGATSISECQESRVSNKY